MTDAGPAARTSEQPLVSVLLASRNGSRYLEESLASLLSQRYPAIEIIAVDDGSTDRTTEILAAFAERHPHARICRTDGIGLAGALALAATHARGVYLARQDDDDRSHPERIARQVAYLESHPAIAVLGTTATMIDAQGSPTGPYPVPTALASIRRTLRRATPFVHGSVMMRREAYDRAGGYRAAFRASQDFDLWLRLGAHAGLANLPDALYEWRSHPGGVFSRARSNQLFYAAVARVFADERRATGSDSCELLARWPEPDTFLASYPGRARLAFYLGELLARDGRAVEARHHLACSMADLGMLGRAVPWWALTWLLPFTSRGRAVARAGR